MDQWHRTAAGHFEREASLTERWMAHNCSLGQQASKNHGHGNGGSRGGRHHWTLSLVLKLGMTIQEAQNQNQTQNQNQNQNQNQTQFDSGFFEEQLIPRLRRAWQDLRRQHPSMASTLDTTRCVWEYHPTTEKGEEEKWLRMTFVVVPFQIEAATLATQLVAPPRPTLHVLPRSQELLLQSPHSSVDGAGLVMMAHLLLSAVTSPKPTTVGCSAVKGLSEGEESDYLAPPFRTTAQAGPFTGRQVKTANAELKRYFAAFPGMTLPTEKPKAKTREGTVRPGKTKRKCHVFDECETIAIAEACRGKGLTVTHAVHAAIACAMARLKSNPAAPDVYTGALSFDGRRIYGTAGAAGAEATAKETCSSMQSLDPDWQLPASLCTTAWLPTIHVSDFECTAEQFKQAYAWHTNSDSNTTNLTNGNINTINGTTNSTTPTNNSNNAHDNSHDNTRSNKRDQYNIVELMIKNILPQLSSSSSAGTSASMASANLSSLGVVERTLHRKYGDDLEVLEYAQLCEVLTASVCMYLHTWRGEMVLSTMFNEVYYDAEFVDLLVGTVLDILTEGLGLAADLRKRDADADAEREVSG
ncbi:hypothetical protein ABEF95_009306 [Exophiala dermatitidis]